MFILKDGILMSDSEREQDMQFAPEDRHELPADMKKVVEDEEPEKFYHPNQTYLAKVSL